MQKYPSNDDDDASQHTSHYQFMRIIEIVSNCTCTCKSARYSQLSQL